MAKSKSGSGSQPKGGGRKPKSDSVAARQRPVVEKDEADIRKVKERVESMERGATGKGGGT